MRDVVKIPQIELTRVILKRRTGEGLGAALENGVNNSNECSARNLGTGHQIHGSASARPAGLWAPAGQAFCPKLLEPFNFRPHPRRTARVGVVGQLKAFFA